VQGSQTDARSSRVCKQGNVPTKLVGLFTHLSSVISGSGNFVSIAENHIYSKRPRWRSATRCSTQNLAKGIILLLAQTRELTLRMQDGRLVSMRFGTYFLSNYVWVYLLNDMLIFATRLLASYRYRGKFDLYATSVVDLPDTNGTALVSENLSLTKSLAFKNILQVKCVGKETWTLSASSSSEKAAWVEAINNAIEEVLNANPTERGLLYSRSLRSNDS
jgi:hypothetical protein